MKRLDHHILQRLNARTFWKSYISTLTPPNAISNQTFSSLREQIRLTYSVNHDIAIKYKDDEGDLVTIASEADLTEAFSGMNGDGILCIHVAASVASSPSIPATGGQAQGSQTEAQAAAEHSQDAPAGSSAGEGASGTRTENTGAREPTPEELINKMVRIAEQMFGIHPAAGGEGRPSNTNERPRNAGQGENAGAEEPSAEELMNNIARIAAHFMDGGATCGGMRRAGYRGGGAARRDIPGTAQWSPEAGRSPVPHPPLTFGSTGDEVRFLQYKLTEMGYMAPADYRYRMGMFGPRTANAVARFRAECGLGYGMYDEEAAAAMQSLLETGVPVAMRSGGSEQEGQASEAGVAQAANADERGDDGKVGA